MGDDALQKALYDRSMRWCMCRSLRRWPVADDRRMRLHPWLVRYTYHACAHTQTSPADELKLASTQRQRHVPEKLVQIVQKQKHAMHGTSVWRAQGSSDQGPWQPKLTLHQPGKQNWTSCSNSSSNYTHRGPIHHHHRHRSSCTHHADFDAEQNGPRPDPSTKPWIGGHQHPLPLHSHAHSWPLPLPHPLCFWHALVCLLSPLLNTLISIHTFGESSKLTLFRKLS